MSARAAWIAGLALGGVAAVGVAVALTSKTASAAPGTTPTPTPGPSPTPTPGPTPTPTPTTSGLPPGPYTNLGKSAKLLSGNTYLMSKSGNTNQLSTDVAAVTAAGFAVLGSWTSQPDGWPNDDTNTSGEFMAVTNNSGSTITNGADVTTWATGGVGS